MFHALVVVSVVWSIELTYRDYFVSDPYGQLFCIVRHEKDPQVKAPRAQMSKLPVFKSFFFFLLLYSPPLFLFISFFPLDAILSILQSDRPTEHVFTLEPALRLSLQRKISSEYYRTLGHRRHFLTWYPLIVILILTASTSAQVARKLRTCANAYLYT